MAANTSPDRSLDTLAIDIGGTGLKASVLDPTGRMEHARVRVDTPYPLSPQKLLLELQELISQLPPFDRVSVGFPGMVRGGRILSAPHFVSPDGPGGTPAPKLVRAWDRFDLAASLEDLTGKPTKVANDADVQGAAVIEGKGFELVVTLGTGVGTAFFSEGQLLPHFEFAHHPLRKGLTYNEVIGEAARKKAGNKKWRVRVLETVETLRALCFFDHCYIGGGNSSRLGPDLPEGVSLVDNAAGILGGIKLWEVTSGHAGEVGNVRHRTPAPAPRPAAARTSVGKTAAGKTAAGKAPGARSRKAGTSVAGTTAGPAGPAGTAGPAATAGAAEVARAVRAASTG
ncbi:MAG TPA: ROK family protein, partial [Acidimicrobiales bacterium]|nr:ROK family protein [Acidimicrobiales bacterium]